MGDSGLRRQRRDAGKDQVWEAVVLRRVAMRDQMRLGLRGIKHGLATEKPRTNSVVIGDLMERRGRRGVVVMGGSTGCDGV
ncbi:hypothetical protein M0R45_026176 [Rubus argutus]|uniref:Uncharacterized protein n=1 Tax=Rubus argutus TaxID=59490 RepID=A0AAW1WZC2_RUBAR